MLQSVRPAVMLQSVRPAVGLDVDSLQGSAAQKGPAVTLDDVICNKCSYTIPEAAEYVVSFSDHVLMLVH